MRSSTNISGMPASRSASSPVTPDTTPGGPNSTRAFFTGEVPEVEGNKIPVSVPNAGREVEYLDLRRRPGDGEGLESRGDLCRAPQVGDGTGEPALGVRTHPVDGRRVELAFKLHSRGVAGTAGG